MINSISSSSLQAFSLSSLKTKPQNTNAGVLATGINILQSGGSQRSGTVVLSAGRGTVAAQRAADQPPSIAEAVRAAFHAVDANGDHKITMDELKAYSARQMSSINNDPSMSDTDKSAAMQNLQSQQQFAMDIFNKFSVNGVLDTRGLAQIVQKLDTIA